MATYRGMDIAESLHRVLPYMSFIGESREALQMLAQRWDMLDILSRVIETGTEVTNTRTEFHALNEALITALANESLNKVVASLSSKAQVTVDLVIRNLFERTADIGFLATDEDLRAFLAGDESTSSDRIRERLNDYQKKYSVYENVVLLDPTGMIRAQAQTAAMPDRCNDDFVRCALSTADPYVESFARSDLTPDAARTLIYSYRIATDRAHGRPLGVLALVFRFADELTGIFRKLLAPEDWTVLTLLDTEGSVLASSDTTQVPLTTHLKIDPQDGYAMIRHAGRRYIAVSRATTGYQGYNGPGWRGCALVPVDCAFEVDENHAMSRLEDWRYQAIAGNTNLFSDAVREIPQRAQTVRTELNRTVWNGALALPNRDDPLVAAQNQDVARRTLLSEISATGGQTKQVFADAVATLNQTAISAIVADLGFSASLAVDIMDRNLYERANDCRWWALTTRFRQVLAQPTPTVAEQAELSSILGYINSLYTVYTSIMVFDRAGTIMAVSDEDQADLVGTAFPADLVKRFTRADRAFYGVSDFDPSPYYAGRPTYIYGASILHPTDATVVVGGIAIVFDSEPQLRSMLDDARPRNADRTPLAGSMALFVDASGRILSSTSDANPIGGTLDLPPGMLIPGGKPLVARVLAWKGELIGVGVCASVGYREYKGPDDAYRNDVFAVCLVHLASDAAPAEMSATVPSAAWPRITNRAGVPVRQIATFSVGDRLLALDCDDVAEAITIGTVPGVSTGPGTRAAYSVHEGKGIAVLEPRGYLSLPNAVSDIGRPIIMLRTIRGNYGIRVDALGEVVTVAEEHVREAGVQFREFKVIKGIIQSTSKESSAMILLLDPDRLVEAILSAA